MATVKEREAQEQQARGIVKRISDAALELAFVRHDLTSDEFDGSEYAGDIKAEVQARESWWEEIKEDTLNCLTGDDSGCNDPDELDATNCELIWLTEHLRGTNQSVLLDLLRRSRWLILHNAHLFSTREKEEAVAVTGEIAAALAAAQE